MDVKNLKFTEDHEWIRIEGDIAVVGISDYAQKELGDVVFVELPPTGESYSQGDPCSNIESVKAVSDIYAPLDGEITEANESLEDKPELVNQEPYGEGWIFKLKMSDTDQLEGLMDHAGYEEFVKGLSGE